MGTTASCVSIFLGALSFVCATCALWTDCWQVNSKGSVVLSMRCRGLWSECVWDKFVKIWTCDSFSSYLNPHPAAVVITRATIIVSAVAGAGAALCLLLGCRYFSCCQDRTIKRSCLRFSAGFYGFASLSSCVGVIRYCVYVFFQHQYEVSLRIPGFPSFEFGYSLWLAVAGNLAAIATAVMVYYDSLLLKATASSPDKEDMVGGTGVLHTYV